MSNPLEPLARHVMDDPFFLAPVLAAYARSEGLDDAGLAAALGCPLDKLAALRLCRAPRAKPRAFREDVAEIAGHFGLDAERLTEVVRHGEALRRMQASAGGRGFLLAARDGAEESPEERPPR